MCKFGRVGRPEDGGLRRHAKSIFGERAILRERMLQFRAKRHPRDMEYHLCRKELRDFERPDGTYTKRCCLDFSHRCAHHRKSPRGQGIRRPRRIRLFPLAVELDRSRFPEYDVVLSTLPHILAVWKRTRAQKLSTGLMGGQLKLAIIGLMLH